MLEFTIDGHEYRADKLSAFQQLHLSRRVSPLIPPLIPVFLRLSKSAGGFAALADQMGELLGPFTEGLAGMSDEAAESIFSTCLSVVKRKQGDNWAAVWNQSAKTVMFADLNDIGAMMPIVMRVIQDSLGPFIRGLLTSQQTESTQA